MHTWKTHIAAVLRRLSETHPQSPLRDIRRTLAAVLEATDVRFIDGDEHELPDELPLNRLGNCSYRVVIDVVGADALAAARPAAAPSASVSVSRAGPAVGSGSRFSPGEAPPTAAEPRARDDAFIREFARLDHSHDFMWAGYIVRELLPRVGYPVEEAKLVLDRLRSEGVLTITKVPNPRNPNFPASGVLLNYTSERVKEVLGTPDASEAGATDVAPSTET